MCPPQPPCALHGHDASQHPLHPIDQHAARTGIPYGCWRCSCTHSHVQIHSQHSTATALWCQSLCACILMLGICRSMFALGGQELGGGGVTPIGRA